MFNNFLFTVMNNKLGRYYYNYKNKFIKYGFINIKRLNQIHKNHDFSLIIYLFILLNKLLLRGQHKSFINIFIFIFLLNPFLKTIERHFLKDFYKVFGLYKMKFF